MYDLRLECHPPTTFCLYRTITPRLQSDFVKMKCDKHEDCRTKEQNSIS
ncbi:hypothetical protein HanPSC8_Chr01g0011231 [Helianthus annuus]|nr:hypothetical protein HanPSC8_Chr01g0011231 [Helianthus annuus]